ncbi:hypothetical protein [Amycolatopsis sp. cmx-4-61]|uniref:hypothetical protein n=1 Tax=Amycolatopsis sp. cmx-4-61 TaxID=2790937 RepID=UPI00397CAC0D
MYRSVRRRLLRTLQPYAPGHTFWQATAVLLLPATYTAAEPPLVARSRVRRARHRFEVGPADT